eukprot:TRINITY_DN13054_c0_g1_i7.p1 TRINITY_DN13054_c0_g1~~TRINITY_DN13054_c0_g1_i7.p1  ORF type:complete len:209 (-),score=48.85 TRINITY_DN13054_c0_g1_i7:147-773(-)
MVKAFNKVTAEPFSEVMLDSDLNTYVDNERKRCESFWNSFIPKGYFTIAIGSIDFILYTILFFKRPKEYKIKFPCSIYNLCADFIVMFIFGFYTFKLYRYIKNIEFTFQPNQKKPNDKFPLISMGALFVGVYLMHIHYRFWLVYSQGELNISGPYTTYLWPIYIIIYYFLTELFPSGVMILYDVDEEGVKRNNESSEGSVSEFPASLN